MDIILYITGGIALLALAGLFISIARTVSGVQAMLAELQGDIHTTVTAIDDVRASITPILANVTKITDNVSHITGSVSSITSGVQNQMVGVHETIDDALDVIRGTLDDLERLKNEVVSSVEGPLNLVRETTGGLIGTGLRIANIILKLVGNRNKKSSMNGRV